MPRSLSQRALDTLVAPRRLAEELRLHSPWIGILVVTTLMAMFIAATLPAEFFLEQLENPVTRRGRPVTLTSPPEQIVLWGRVMQALAALVNHQLLVFAVAGVLTLLFTVVGGGKVGFQRYLALTAHAFLITTLGALLLHGWQWISGDREAQFSLAALLGGPGAGDGLLIRALEIVNPFTLWMLVVLAIGVGVLDRKRSFPQALVVLLGLYLALSFGIAALGDPASAALPS